MSKSKMAEEIAALREQRWTATVAKRVLAAWEESGSTLTEFSREHDVQDQRLMRWRRRLREETTARPIQFAPAVVLPAEGQAAIRLPDGLVVELAQPTPEWMAALVRGLSGASS